MFNERIDVAGVMMDIKHRVIPAHDVNEIMREIKSIVQAQQEMAGMPSISSLTFIDYPVSGKNGKTQLDLEAETEAIKQLTRYNSEIERITSYIVNVRNNMYHNIDIGLYLPQYGHFPKPISKVFQFISKVVRKSIKFIIHDQVKVNMNVDAILKALLERQDMINAKNNILMERMAGARQDLFNVIAELNNLMNEKNAVLEQALQQSNQFVAASLECKTQIDLINKKLDQISATQRAVEEHIELTQRGLQEQLDSENERISSHIAFATQNIKSQENSREQMMMNLLQMQTSVGQQQNLFFDLHNEMSKLKKDYSDLLEDGQKTVANLNDSMDSLGRKADHLSSRIDNMGASREELVLALEQCKAKINLIESSLQNKEDKEDLTFLSGAKYVRFENSFRGNENDILQRQQRYFEKYIAGKISGNHALDIGCGRGEWMSYLAKNKYSVVGIDINPKMAEECAKKGLTVMCGDANTIMHDIAASSIDIITCFQVVEHISKSDVDKMLNECYRVMNEDGILIIETPNIANLEVGATSFHLDPTHINPLHPELLKYLAMQAGFTQVETVYINQRKTDDWLNSLTSGDEIVSQSTTVRAMLESLKSKLYCDPDYAIIARKVTTKNEDLD